MRMKVLVIGTFIALAVLAYVLLMILSRVPNGH